MFLNYLALGSKQRDLADRYGVHQSTVSRIITTWSNFLYTVLGSVRIWIPEEKIREHLPAEFKDYADTTVILDCTELRCQSPSSPLLQSETFSTLYSPTVLSKGCLEWLLTGQSHLSLHCMLVPSVTNRSRRSLEFSPF